MKSIHGKGRKDLSEKVSSKASTKNARKKEDGLGDMSSGEEPNMDDAQSDNEVNGIQLENKVC